jgi:DNA-binding PadR family transcriptional regulator
MSVRRFNDDVIDLTLREISILTAASGRPLDGMDIARSCAEFEQNGGLMSLGTLYPALRRLYKMGFLDEVELRGTVGPGKPRRLYVLSGTGRMMLEWELDRLGAVVRVGQERLALLAKRRDLIH